jgi:mannosyl-3-phosphoglycerate synthase
MRLEKPNRFERFGAVRIHSLQQVLEFDSGAPTGHEETPAHGMMVRHVPHESLRKVFGNLAVVVPCMNERRKVIEGVFTGIPHDCLIILVSNSSRDPVDRFDFECQTLEHFCHATERSAIAVHQRDPGLAAAMAAGGIPQIVDDDGLVRTGKGEGMLIGLALAALAGKSHVGFVDADNYVPGAINEYVRSYAAGFHAATTPYSMVRISWQSKPKLQDGRLFFNRWGRTSQVTNRFLNLLLAEYSGFGTEIISTGNAGEHALSMELGLRLRLAGGFAVEPFEYLDMFEQFGGVVASPRPEVLRSTVDVFQIETRNPHFHENKGSDHVQEMRLQALNVLYHSPICPETTREEILEFLVQQGALEPGGRPPTERIYPPLIDFDRAAFLETLREEASSYTAIQKRRVAGVIVEEPILVLDDEFEPAPPTSGGDGPTPAPPVT